MFGRKFDRQANEIIEIINQILAGNHAWYGDVQGSDAASRIRRALRTLSDHWQEKEAEMARKDDEVARLLRQLADGQLVEQVILPGQPLANLATTLNDLRGQLLGLEASIRGIPGPTPLLGVFRQLADQVQAVTNDTVSASTLADWLSNPSGDLPELPEALTAALNQWRHDWAESRDAGKVLGILQAAPLPLLLLDGAATIVWQNDAMQQLFDSPPQTLADCIQVVGSVITPFQRKGCEYEWHEVTAGQGTLVYWTPYILPHGQQELQQSLAQRDEQLTHYRHDMTRLVETALAAANHGGRRQESERDLLRLVRSSSDQAAGLLTAILDRCNQHQSGARAAEEILQGIAAVPTPWEGDSPASASADPAINEMVRRLEGVIGAARGLALTASVEGARSNDPVLGLLSREIQNWAELGQGVGEQMKDVVDRLIDQVNTVAGLARALQGRGGEMYRDVVSARSQVQQARMALTDAIAQLPAVEMLMQQMIERVRLRDGQLGHNDERLEEIRQQLRTLLPHHSEAV